MNSVGDVGSLSYDWLFSIDSNWRISADPNWRFSTDAIWRISPDANNIKVDHIEDDRLEPSFAKKMHELQRKTEQEYYFRLGDPIAISFLQKIRLGQNCYTGLRYGDIFDIQDCQVDIHLPASSEEKFEKMGLHRYITVNPGNGSFDDSGTVSSMSSSEIQIEISSGSDVLEFAL